MRERLSCKIKRIWGFTLAEVLIVVGILAILAAVSFPALISMRNSLRQTELDETAKQIFITAQNKMSGMRLRGEDTTDLGGVSLSATDGDEPLSATDGRTPSDMPESGAGPDSYALCDGAAGSEAEFSWMNDTAFAPSYVAADGGSYVIEYNGALGAVYGVYYWEGGGQAFQKKSTFEYPAHFNIYDGKELRGDANRKNRMTPSVGYYGGAGASAGAVIRDLAFDLKVKNDARLELEITLDTGLYSEAAFDVTVSSRTESENKSAYVYSIRDGTVTAEPPEAEEQTAGSVWLCNNTDGAGSSTYTLTLDSLEGGLHFADNFKRIAAGDDLRITVTGYGAGGETVYIPQTRTVEINSLFAGVRGGADGDEVYLENGRHLQNLSYEVSGLGARVDDTGREIVPEKVKQVRAAKLTRDIDWRAEVYDTADGPQSYDAACTLRGADEPVNFYPISNHTTGLVSFEGNNHRITGLHVTNYAEVFYEDVDDGRTGYGYAGMFGYMQDRGYAADKNPVNRIRDVTLVNPLVEPGEPADGVSVEQSCAGSLGGYLSTVWVENCRAYVESADAGETTAEKYEKTGVKADCGYVGGLIGDASNLKASKSFASLKVAGVQNTGGKYIGGFAGRVSYTDDGASEISMCYSGGSTKGGVYIADKPNVSGQSGAMAVGGFAGLLDDRVTVERSFSTCSVKGTGDWTQVGAFVGRNGDGAAPEFVATYGMGTVFTEDDQTAGAIGCGTVEDAMAAGGRIAGSEASHPYDEFYRKNNTGYPCPVWLDAYYGDWSVSGEAVNGFVYYEVYRGEDGQDLYGFWSAADGAASDDSLQNGSLRDDLPVLSDGYGYLSESILDDASGKDKGVFVKQKDKGTGFGTRWTLGRIDVTVDGAAQYLYAFPWDGLTHIGTGEFETKQGQSPFYSCRELIIGDRKNGSTLKVYYNPHFAKAIGVNTGTEENPAVTAPENAVIRTARHLYELGENSDYWDSGWSYVQERDIDYEVYQPRKTYKDTTKKGNGNGSGNGNNTEPAAPENLSQGVIGNKKSEDEFEQTYDGGNHEIANLHMGSDAPDTRKDLALFGYVAQVGVLKDIVLVRPVLIGGDSTLNAASLACVNGGTLSNVKVISPHVENRMFSAAGLVMDNTGTITDSFIIPEQKEAPKDERYLHSYNDQNEIEVNNYTNAYIAGAMNASGFVGSNSGTIKGCGVAASVTASGDMLGGTAAGFVHTNSGTVALSYANCYTAGESGAAGFAYTTRGRGQIKGCYALRRVTVMKSGGTVAGFAAEDGAGTIIDSYAAVSVGYCPDYRAQPGGVITYENCVYDAAALDGITNLKMFIQFSRNDQTNCYYMDWAENYAVEGKGSSGAKGLSYTELCKLSVSGLQTAKEDGSDTEVFSRTLPYVYPFPKAPGMIQYGDWPESGYVGAEMTYFEVYREAGSNKYLLGFYNEMLDLNSLPSDEDLPIFLDGYGLLFSADYVELGDGALDDLIRGNTGDNRRAYVSWLDNRGTDSTTETHGLKNVYDMKDNAGADIEAGVYYKDAGGTEKEIGRSVDYSDTPISLKLNGRVNDYYFRILPAAATVTTAYVNSDSVYQELSIHETSAAYDELGGKAGRAIEKEQVFYYCPHFAKSAISKDEPPKGEPTSLTVRTPRQLSTLCYGNNMSGQNGITNYYDCSFVQERDIDYGIDGIYAYYYVDEPMDDAGRGKPSSYRWFNSSIGSQDKPFTGSYDGGGHSIIGLGRWVGLKRPFEENEAFTNADVPLFGVLSGKALISKTAVSGSRMEFPQSTDKNPKGMLAGMVTGKAQLSGCAVKDSRVIVETSDVQCIGMAVGRMSGGTIDGLTLENIEMTAGGARRIGGAVGLIEGGSIQKVTVSGEVTIQADRAAGVVAGQIMSGAGGVSLSGIKLTGKISLTQMTASNNTEIWDGVGLIAGLCEVGNHSVDVGDIEIAAADDTAPITVTSATGSRFYVAGLVFGTVYPTKQATGTLSLGTIGVHGARLLMNTPSNQKVCSYGGLAGAVGNESRLSIESSKEITWDFSGSRIEVSSDKDNHYDAASGVAGLIGNVKKDVELTLPGKVILPDVSVKVQPGHSIPVSGVANNTSGASMALRSPEGSHSDICLGDITTENCDNTGGVTAVLTDKTTLGELLVSGLSGKGTIRASGNAGGIAGTVDVMNTETALLRNLSVSGIKITGAGNLGGFAGLVRSGAVRQCFANAEVTAAYPAASGAGGFVGAIDTAVGGTVSAPAVTITDCYASGAVHADGAAAAGQPQPQSDLKAGGFFGEAVSKSKMTVSGCYSTGDVTVTEANAAAKSAVGGFGGRIADDSDASVTGCYSLGKVAEKAAGMSTNLSAGGFVGYMPSASGQPTTEIRQPETVDSMLQSMIRILKNAEIHNRIPSQNGKTCWEINNITMDSDTRGIFDYEKNPATGEQYEFSAMVYNVLGYPKYTDMLKNFADPVTGRAPTGALVRMYNRFLFDGNGEIKKPDDDQDYQKSYYNTFYEPSLHYNLMRRWSIQNGGYFYWVNSTDVGSVEGYRINLEDYDNAVTGKQPLADRMGMIETGKVTVGQKTGSYKLPGNNSPENYIAITDVGNSWGKQETGILSDCCFLREDGTTLPAYNQRYTDGGGAKLWAVEDFSAELQREAANSGRMFLNMQPDSRSASAEFTGYPYPMIKNCGAGINEVTRPGGLAHDGGWPAGYHPVFTPPQP